MILRLFYFSWAVTSAYYLSFGLAYHNFSYYIIGTVVFCLGGFILQTINQKITQHAKALAAKTRPKKRRVTRV